MRKTPWDVLRELYERQINAGFQVLWDVESGATIGKAWIAGDSCGWLNHRPIEKIFRHDELDQVAAWLQAKSTLLQ